MPFHGLFRLMRWYVLLCGVLVNAGVFALAGYAGYKGNYWISEKLDWLKDRAFSGHYRVQQRLGALAERLRAEEVPVADDELPDRFSYVALPDPPAEEHVGYGRVLRVGPNEELKTPAHAARVAQKGDLIRIAPGRYAGNWALWQADDLLIRGDGGVVHIDDAGTPIEEDKAIWVTQGNNIRIENIEFSGAKSRDLNGAGIRAEGNRLHVVHCFFHDNESGVLSSYVVPTAKILIEYSEFARNGHPNGAAHQVYAAAIAEFEVRHSYFHQTFIGSAIKSRALKTVLAYNRIADGARGRSNYAVDLSEGGHAYLVGNLIQHGPKTENYHLVTFAPESNARPSNELYMVNNTLVNDRGDGVFLRNNTKSPAFVYNNLMIGPGRFVDGPAKLVGNLAEGRRKGMFRDSEPWPGIAGSHGNRSIEEIDVRDRANLDYRLQPKSAAVDAALPLEDKPADGVDLTPRFEYVDPSAARPRHVKGKLDVGALELE